MKLNKSLITAFLLLLALVIPKVAPSAESVTFNTNGRQSPLQKCEHNSTCTNNFYKKELVGKKLAIRSIYLMPNIGDMTKEKCGDNVRKCDFYESANIFLEVQSIWPEPFMLTSASIKLKANNKAIYKKTALYGENVLETQITGNHNLKDFLLLPGDIKLIALSEGLTLEGVMEFFKGEVLDSFTFDEFTPIKTADTETINAFNIFLARHYGKNATIRISLFEKDYQPALTTDVKLSQGSDLFAKGDVVHDKYQLQHDSFIGETLYQLRGGKDSFMQRLDKMNKAKSNQNSIKTENSGQ